MSYPENDTDFADVTITEVRSKGDCWSFGHGGLWFGFEKSYGITPEVGQIARFYPREEFARKRGLFIDGQKVYYRTAAEDDDYHEIQMYGADAADWLSRWDADNSVWSIEMGGLGPGYEQCIQITAAEIVRELIKSGIDLDDENARDKFNKKLDSLVMKRSPVKELGLSGAQWGAACNLASFIYKNGPRAMMRDERVKDRHIQVQRKFPQVA